MTVKAAGGRTDAKVLHASCLWCPFNVDAELRVVKLNFIVSHYPFNIVHVLILKHVDSGILFAVSDQHSYSIILDLNDYYVCIRINMSNFSGCVALLYKI